MTTLILYGQDRRTRSAFLLAPARRVRLRNRGRLARTGSGSPVIFGSRIECSRVDSAIDCAHAGAPADGESDPQGSSAGVTVNSVAATEVDGLRVRSTHASQTTRPCSSPCCPAAPRCSSSMVRSRPQAIPGTKSLRSAREPCHKVGSQQVAGLAKPGSLPNVRVPARAARDFKSLAALPPAIGLACFPRDSDHGRGSFDLVQL